MALPNPYAIPAAVPGALPVAAVPSINPFLNPFLSPFANPAVAPVPAPVAVTQASPAAAAPTADPAAASAPAAAAASTPAAATSAAAATNAAAATAAAAASSSVSLPFTLPTAAPVIATHTFTLNGTPITVLSSVGATTSARYTSAGPCGVHPSPRVIDDNQAIAHGATAVGAIAGGTVGGVAGLAALVGLALVLVRRKGRGRGTSRKNNAGWEGAESVAESDDAKSAADMRAAEGVVGGKILRKPVGTGWKSEGESDQTKSELEAGSETRTSTRSRSGPTPAVPPKDPRRSRDPSPGS